MLKNNVFYVYIYISNENILDANFMKATTPEEYFFCSNSYNIIFTNVFMMKILLKKMYLV